MATELDYMEYVDNAAAQAEYVTDADSPFVSQYPPAHSSTYVKATTDYGAPYVAHKTTDPVLTLTGGWSDNQWRSNATTNQRFHIDLGSAKIITKVYYENSHNSGANVPAGAQNFTIWGSNTEASFLELTYAIDTGWTQITPSQSTFDIHVGAAQADPKYLTLTNSTAYRYYAFKFADNYGDSGTMGVRRLDLQMAIPNLQSYSEDTIVEQGTYSLKGVAAITDSLNDTLTRTVSPTIDLSGLDSWIFYIYSNRTGSNIKVGIHDSGGTTTEITPNVASAGAWQKVEVDISGVADANKDAIDSIIITIVNADAENIFYIDNMYAESVVKKVLFFGANF